MRVERNQTQGRLYSLSSISAVLTQGCWCLFCACQLWGLVRLGPVAAWVPVNPWRRLRTLDICGQDNDTSRRLRTKSANVPTFRPTTGSSTVLQAANPSPINVQGRFNTSNDDDGGDQRDALNLLLIDHYDSFTYNLVDLLTQVNRQAPAVVAVDCATSWTNFVERYRDNHINSTASCAEELERVRTVLSDLDGVILSPGPGSPSDALYALSRDLIQQASGSAANESSIHATIVDGLSNVPILGVCLGHQLMGTVHGATVDLAPHGEVHGQVWPVVQTSERTLSSSEPDATSPPSLWNNVPKRFHATRYHSLHVVVSDEWSKNTTTTTSPLRCTAVSERDNLCMAMEHTELPQYGVQFHPESIGSLVDVSHHSTDVEARDDAPRESVIPIGRQLLENFCDICHYYKQQRRCVVEPPTHSVSSKLLAGRHNGVTKPNGALDTINLVRKDIGTSVKSSPTPTKITSSNDSKRKNPNGSHSVQSRSSLVNSQDAPGASVDNELAHKVYVHKVPSEFSMLSPEQVMKQILRKEEYCFWLDTSLVSGDRGNSMSSSPDASDPMNAREGLRQQSSAVSILGWSSTGRRIEYWGRKRKRSEDGSSAVFSQPLAKEGLYIWDGSGDLEVHTGPEDDILSYLEQQHRHRTDRLTIVDFDYSCTSSTPEAVLSEQGEGDIEDLLPFDYRGGHVGYLGYEVRHDTERYLQEKEFGGKGQIDKSLANERAGAAGTNVCSTPTAAFVWADRNFVYDHESGDWYLVCVTARAELPEDVLRWMRSAAELLRKIPEQDLAHGAVCTESSSTAGRRKLPRFRPNRSKETYNKNFNQCLEFIRHGESYELCLTNQFKAEIEVPGSSPFGFYTVLRKQNPAPFSAFFNWNGENSKGGAESFSICCSSPERFVAVKRKRLGFASSDIFLEAEAKPIKGTCARVAPLNGEARTPRETLLDAQLAEKLKASVKNRAENLMIVDLLRNDLSRICKAGSVSVAKLMDIESFATVHQMVSTITGTLDPAKSSAVDVLKSCFPGGSMTGAPKLKSMELLDMIEEGVERGVYSGSLG